MFHLSAETGIVFGAGSSKSKKQISQMSLDQNGSVYLEKFSQNNRTMEKECQRALNIA